MKKPALLFALKFGVIMYFAACTNIDRLTATKSISQSVIRNDWKVNFYADANLEKTAHFKDYAFSFKEDGKLTVSNNGKIVKGNWYEDYAKNSLIITVAKEDATLNRLNDGWEITNAGDGSLSFAKGNEKLNLNSK